METKSKVVALHEATFLGFSITGLLCFMILMESNDMTLMTEFLGTIGYTTLDVVLLSCTNGIPIVGNFVLGFILLRKGR